MIADNSTDPPPAD